MDKDTIIACFGVGIWITDLIYKTYYGPGTTGLNNIYMGKNNNLMQ